ncbi:MAG: hypothetical protein PHQ87_14855 [Hydrogenophaga sp.]|uniref:hypothetical protein n=1 Tax=Hydrogenophaga sp. TaxID=1904254 RepID=UPI00261D199F|nr:hypothetical protein [Hydrogenophaga sp.]MDD3786821.1 hypothetical protein [Hydrogenophaga sp.]MDX9969990.1 hypothetical protein [Hydrogenophaga sp.]
MMKNGIKKSTAQEQKWTRRHMGVAAMAGVAAVFLSGCIGGGGGGSSDDDDVDLRAAYDRIQEGMDHAAVARAVGVQPSNPENKITQYWDSGNQHMSVGFSEWSGRGWLVGSVHWWTSSGRELTKTF